MNPSPDRSKECLPPKKRESRQGSSDQPAPEDDFKSPAPLRSRRHRCSAEGHRESADLQPPPLPPLPPLPPSLPWQVSYAPSMHHPYMPIQVSERRGSLSASWRDTMCGRRMEGELDHPVSHHPRWLCGDIPPLNLEPFISVPTFKSVYMSESMEMWPYSHTRRGYSSSFSSHLYPRPTVYPHDSLPDSRLRYHSRRPNGVDGPDSGSASSRGAPFCNDDGNNIMTSLDGSCANGQRRQEGTARQSTGKGLLAQESTSTTSSPRDRDPWGTLKAPMPPFSDAKAGKIASQDYYSGSASQAGAQIYYALGTLCPTAHQNPQAYSHHCPSLPPRNSQRSPHSQHNIHGAETEWDTSAGLYRPAVAVLTGPDPPPSAVLPHFAKGSLIELAGGHLKRVEELKTEDFLRSADTLPEFHLSTCTILLISPGPTHGFNHLQVLLTDRNTQELLTVLTEYPFFVRDHGWSSCSPQRSAQMYGLQCRQLSTGDVCLALTPTPTAQFAHSGSQVQRSGAGELTCTGTTERMPPPPAPPHLPVALTSPPGTRKRRWSAPELQSGSGTSPRLPHGCKQERRQ